MSCDSLKQQIVCTVRLCVRVMSYNVSICSVVRWKMTLFVMPSQEVWYTAIALAVTCVVGAIIVIAFHLYEKVTKQNVHLLRLKINHISILCTVFTSFSTHLL